MKEKHKHSFSLTPGMRASKANISPSFCQEEGSDLALVASYKYKGDLYSFISKI